MNRLACFVLLLLVLLGSGTLTPTAAGQPTTRHQLALNQALISSVEGGDVAQVRRLLAPGADANAVDDQGMAPLIVAAVMNNTAAMTLLLAHHPNVSLRDQTGDTALMFAATERNQ